MSKLITANIDLSGKLNEFRGIDIASAATTDIGAATGNFIHITGNETILSLGVAPQAGVRRTVVFENVLTLTYNSNAIKLPGLSNIVTASGDKAVFIADTTTTWECISYTRATGVDTTTVQSVITNSSTLSASQNSATVFVKTSGTPIVITIPANLPKGFNALFIQDGVDTVSFVEATGVVIKSLYNMKKLQGTSVGAYLEKDGITNTFYLIGKLKT